MKSKDSRAEINVNGTQISMVASDFTEDYFVSLTDMTKNFDGGSALIENWIRSKDTLLFLGTWEKLYNPDFKYLEFEGIKNEAGSNSFYLSIKKYVNLTNAKGIKSTAGRYGGTYAHKDIAFEFGSWLSPEFKLYLIKEYQRLKDDENSRLSLDWNINRTLSKINYRLHTDAIKDNLIPECISKVQQGMTYASEAEVLNQALFGKTSKEWREENKNLKGNIRDVATLEQLLVMANLESLNAELIRRGVPQNQRLLELNKTARTQLQSLLNNRSVQKLKQ